MRRDYALPHGSTRRFLVSYQGTQRGARDEVDRRLSAYCFAQMESAVMAEKQKTTTAYIQFSRFSHYILH